MSEPKRVVVIKTLPDGTVIKETTTREVLSPPPPTYRCECGRTTDYPGPCMQCAHS